MVMEKAPLDPLPLVKPNESIDFSLRPDRVVSVRLNSIPRASYNYWCRLIRERIAPYYREYFPPDPKRNKESTRIGHLHRLMDFSEFAGISDIWLSSPFVSDAEVKAAGAIRIRMLTRQSFSRRLQILADEAGEKSDIGTFEARGTRLIDAMLSHQLLEEDLTIRPNLKPLQGTGLLDALMVAYHKNLALLWDHAVDGPLR
jgi:hypothetical protein